MPKITLQKRTGSKRATRELSIKKNMIWNSFGSLSYLFCQWLITVFIVRMSAGYDAAGAYTLALTVYNIFMPLAQYGMSVYQLSDTRDEHSAGEYLAFRIGISFVTLALIMVYSFITCEASNWLTIFLLSVFMLIGRLTDVPHTTMQKRRRMDYIGISNFLQGAVPLVVFFISFYCTQNLNVTLVLMSVVTVLIWYIYIMPRALLFSSFEITISWHKAKKLLIACFPVVVATFAASAAPSLPRQYLAATLGNAALGAYGTLAAPVALLQMVATYIYNPLLTYFREYFETKQLHNLRALMLKTCVAIVVFGVLCALIVALVGGPVMVLIYGEKIAEYIYLLQPLVLCAVLTGLQWFFSNLAQTFRFFGVNLAGCIAGLAAALLSIWFFVDHFQLNGVTWTCVFSCVVVLLVMGVGIAFRLRRHMA